MTYRVLGQGALALVLLLHGAALYWPRVEGPPAPGHTDKVVHALLFMLPVVVAVLARLPWRALAVVLAVHAPLSEGLQELLLPRRSGDPWDALADLVGVGLGALVATWWEGRRPAGGRGLRPGSRGQHEVSSLVD